MTYRYPAIFNRQRESSDAPLFACFVAPAGEIAEWAEVERITHDGMGHQRLRNASRIGAIARFLEFNDRNTIPTALIVALRLDQFDDATDSGLSTITIPRGAETRPGLVIDGQHRMYGVEKFDPSLPLNVVGLINPTDEETAFQFLVINNKASKVPTDHVRFLSLKYEDDVLAKRLKAARMGFGRNVLVGVVDESTDSPFYKSVIWPTEASAASEDRLDLVRPATIEQALTAIALRNLPDLSDDDSLIEFFFTLWRAIKEEWPELWVSESKLLQKVGLVTMTMFVIDDLIPLADREGINLADPDQVRQEVDGNILSYLNPEFWEREWSAKSLDTSAGRKLVVDALAAVRRNIRRRVPWDTEVSLVGVADDDG